MYFEKEVKVVRFFVLVWLVMNITLMPLAAAYDSGNDEVSVVRKVVVLDENGVFGKVTPVTGLQDVSKKGSGENLSLSAMAVWFLLVTLFAGSGYVKYGKKAQFNGTLIVLLAVLTAGVIIIFGYNIIKSNLSSQCDTSLKLFQEKTKAAIDGAARNAGSVNEFEYKGLCEIDEIYFVDKSKEIDVSELSDMPEIQGSVDSSSKDNVFLMMDNELEESFDIGDIDIPSPNYLCFVVNNGNLVMMMEGMGSATRPKHKENMFNCGSTIIEPTVEEVRDILVDDVLDAGTPVAFTGALPSTDENVLTDLFSETKEHVDMSREEIECLGNDAVVEMFEN